MLRRQPEGLTLGGRIGEILLGMKSNRQALTGPGLGCGRVAKLARALQPALRPLGIRRLGARKQVGKTERGLRAALRGRFLEPGARLGCVARRDKPVQIEDREQVLSLGITGGCEPLQLGGGTAEVLEADGGLCRIERVRLLHYRAGLLRRGYDARREPGKHRQREDTACRHALTPFHVSSRRECPRGAESRTAARPRHSRSPRHCGYW